MKLISNVYFIFIAIIFLQFQNIGSSEEVFIDFTSTDLSAVNESISSFSAEESYVAAVDAGVIADQNTQQVVDNTQQVIENVDNTQQIGEEINNITTASDFFEVEAGPNEEETGANEEEEEEEEEEDEEEDDIEGIDLDDLFAENQEDADSSTFNLDFIRILDGSNEPFYKMFLTSVTSGIDQESFNNETVIAFKNKLSNFYDPTATVRSSSNQFLINAVQELEVQYNTTLVQAMSAAFDYEQKEPIETYDDFFQSKILDLYNIFTNNKDKLNFEENNNQFDQDQVIRAIELLDHFQEEVNKNYAPATLYNILLSGAVISAGIVVFNL
jgi:hypothetical protein